MNKNTLLKVILIVTLSILAVFLVLSSSISHLINSLISNGYSYQSLYPLISMPLIALFVAISRIIVGINLSSVYLPTLLVVSSFYLNPILIFGLFTLILTLSYLIKLITNKLHVHFAIKVSLINSLVCLFILPVLFLIKGSFTTNIDPIILVYSSVILALIGEKFLTFKFTKSSFFIEFSQLLKNLAFSAICYYLLGGEILGWQFTPIMNFIKLFPEITIISVILILAIGRYTGLRISEIYRFRKLIFKSK